MNKLIQTFCGLALLGLATQANAVLLSLQPTAQTAAPGDTVMLDLVIDGLGNFGPDSLGTFDVDLAFDTSALSFTGYSMGTLLGDTTAGEAIDFSFGHLGGGIIDLAELSLLTVAELDALQPATFTLATLEFHVDVLSPGSSTTVAIDSVQVLGDAFGISLALDGTSDAVIRAETISTPEPSLLLLLGTGLALVGIVRRRSLLSS